MVLKQEYPDLRQIQFWDNYIIALSKVADRITFFKLAKPPSGFGKKQTKHEPNQENNLPHTGIQRLGKFLDFDAQYRNSAPVAWPTGVVAINDGSDDEFDSDFNSSIPIEVVSLKSNVGHQRAIAIGLQYINAEKTDFDFVVDWTAMVKIHPSTSGNCGQMRQQ
jgi:hypothetical protein